MAGKRLVAYVIKDVENDEYLDATCEWRSRRFKAVRFLPNAEGLAKAKRFAAGTGGQVFRLIRRTAAAGLPRA